MRQISVRGALLALVFSLLAVGCSNAADESDDVSQDPPTPTVGGAVDDNPSETDNDSDLVESDDELTVGTQPQQTTTTAQPSPGSPDELIAAAEAGKNVFGTFLYLTITPLCTDSCDTAPIQLYLVPGSDDARFHEVRQAWQNGEEISFADEPWILDPLNAPTALLDALDDGKSVDFEVDPASGVLVSYAIDGEGAQIDCFGLDVAPLEQRERDCVGRFYQRS